MRQLILRGRIILRANVKLLTGLHIGGAAGGLEIGGVNSPVIRNPLTEQPYIPGSSLRGKMRSLAERHYGKVQNFAVNQVRGKEVYIHTCQADKKQIPGDETGYQQWVSTYQTGFNACEVCSVFGVTGDEPVSHPTALLVRDAYLSKASAEELRRARTDLPYTEIKWEATIDRVTSAATPRQIERVPAGACFENMELVYNLYDTAGAKGLTHFGVVLHALRMVEEDYLGGLGSRGGGKVRFELTGAEAWIGAQENAVPLCTLTTEPIDGQAVATIRTNRNQLLAGVQSLFA